MKKIFYITIFALNLLFASNLFAEFQYGFSIPLGAGITVHDISIDYKATRPINKPVHIQDYISVELGLLAQVGYNFNFSNTNSPMKGIGLFLDFGYHMHSEASKHNYFDTTALGINSLTYEQMYFFNSINIGLLSKLNFKNYSFGFGGGVRVPISGEVGRYDIYSTTDSNLPEEDGKDLNYSELKNIFKYLVAPYIKITFEYRFPINNKKFSPMLGLYYLYDFGMEFKTSTLNANADMVNLSGLPYFKKYSYSGVSLGVLLGMYFW